MKPHPLSELFPAMDGQEYDELVSDIREHGLAQPIVMYQGKILDGRNRVRACEQLGIKPKTVDYRGQDALGHVVSLNLNRRHLTPGQRAMVAEKIVTFTHGGARSKGSRDPLLSEVSRERAAEIAGASTGTMKRVRTVLEKGTQQLQDAVAVGKIEPNVAAKVAEATPAKQREAVKGGKEVAREIAREVTAEKKAEKDAPAKPTIRTLGISVPHEVMARAAKEQDLVDKIGKLLADAKRAYTELEKLRGVEQVGKGNHISTGFRTALNELGSLQGTRPACVCPHCKLIPELRKTCAACRTSGFIGEHELNQIEKCLLSEGDESGVWVRGKWKTYAEMTGDDS